MKAVDALLAAADSAWKTGQAEQARLGYLQVLELHAHEPIALQRLAWLEDDRGRPAQAIALLRRLISIAPNDARAHQDLGLCLQKLGQSAEATAAFRRATEVNPNYAPAFCNLGLALEDAGDLAGAKVALQRASALQPASSFIAYHLAAVSGSTTMPICPPDYLTQLFNGYADRFDSHLFDQLSYQGPGLLYEIVASHEPATPWDILDLGCGTGMSAVLFRGRAKSIVGVDLSPRMLEHAARRITRDGQKVYDALVQADVVAALHDRPSSFDLILAADVFIYIGDLRPVLTAGRAALRPGGLIAFTAESLAGPGDYQLLPTRRYAQSSAYIARLAAELQLTLIDHRHCTLRQGDDGKPVAGDIYLLQRPRI